MNRSEKNDSSYWRKKYERELEKNHQEEDTCSGESESGELWSPDVRWWGHEVGCALYQMSTETRFENLAYPIGCAIGGSAIVAVWATYLTAYVGINLSVGIIKKGAEFVFDR